MARIVIIGAGVGGLGTAIGLADRGHDVLVLERDPPPPTTDGGAAFEAWDRRHVPQFYASRPPRNTGPDRAELLAIIERSRPASENSAASAASPAAYQTVRTAR